MSNSSIMSVRDLIDFAFGDDDTNTVNFKLIQTILFLLARQLRILERRVNIVVPPDSRTDLQRTNISVSEIRMQANIVRNYKKLNRYDDQQTEKGGAQKRDLKNLMDEFELFREKELRIINQRKDSREEPGYSPTPIGSVESTEVQYEKLLVVERVPPGEVKSSEQTKELPVVTQKQFCKLVTAVKALQEKLGTIATPGFAETEKLMRELRCGASLTDAMAALQLSARIEAAEKALEKMLSLLTDIAQMIPGADVSRLSTLQGAELKSGVAINIQSEATVLHGPEDKNLDHSAWITIDELDEAMEAFHQDILKEVNGINSRNAANTDNVVKTVSRLESKLNESLELGNRMEELEKIVKEYTDQINNLDTGLSSQMTNYQEQLTQMQYDLDTGLEAMAEALANTGGDTTAVAELNAHFTSLQVDFDNANLKQKELQNIQNALAFDLQNLWEQIENLRDIKSDRDEVADALKDKVGIGALNGILSQAQFDAVRGDFEKRISAAYNKFNNQECVWQKALDDLQRILNEKADLVQVICLRDDINNNLEMLRGRLQAMLEVVGEPKAAALTRKIHRDGKCLSCSTPAHMEIEEPFKVPTLPPFGKTRPSVIGAEAEDTNKEEKDGLCYPGYPVQHAIDSRAHFCNRFCGGSHTLLPGAKARVPAGVFVTSTEKHFATTLGTDGKSYLVDEICKQKPCLPCNQAKPVTPIEPIQAPAVRSKNDAEVTSTDKQHIDEKVSLDSVSRTPEMIEDCYCES